VLICEGPDGSGKSTLCQMLKHDGVVDTILPSPRITANKDVERMKYETERYIRLHGDNNRVCVDRFLFSEVAYGKILRGRSHFTKGDYLHKLVQLMLKGSIVIFCLPDKLHFKADESEFLISKMPEIRAKYEMMVQEQAFTSPYTYVYKWDTPNAFEELKQFIKEKSLEKHP
jgi:hypothetical protein